MHKVPCVNRQSQALAKQQAAHQKQVDTLMAEMRKLQVVPPPPTPVAPATPMSEASMDNNPVVKALMEKLEKLEDTINKSKTDNNSTTEQPDGQDDDTEDEGDTHEHIVTPDGKTVLWLNCGLQQI